MSNRDPLTVRSGLNSVRTYNTDVNKNMYDFRSLSMNIEIEVRLYLTSKVKRRKYIDIERRDCYSLDRG